MAGERRNSRVAPSPSTASLPAFLSAQSWVPSLVVSNRSPTSTRLGERITKGFGRWEFQGWGWIQSLAEVIPFPFSPLPSALDSFPWGSEDASIPAGSCPYRAATSRHSQLLSPGSSSQSPGFGIFGLAQVTCLSLSQSLWEGPSNAIVLCLLE